MTETMASIIPHLRSYLQNPAILNEGIEQDFHSFDQKRVEAVPLLRSLLMQFLDKKISLQEFKEKNELACRQYSYWGFKNFSGQMQLNQYNNNISSKDKDEVLRAAIKIPSSETEAKEKINNLASYLRDLKNKSEVPKSVPRVAQSYMLSYFWEIQEPEKWPVYYGSSKKALTSFGHELDLYETPGDEYLAFAKIVEDFTQQFQHEAPGEKHYMWLVEHVLWRIYHMQDEAKPEALIPQPQTTLRKSASVLIEAKYAWVPSIVSDLEPLAQNQETDWAKKKGLKPEKAFETKLKYAFTLLGYETTELGQGKGREPDGVALSMGVADGDYAIVYDAKSREQKFNLGTADREIYEYILKKRDELKKSRINKLYFVIISSEFDETGNYSSLRDIYRRTQVPVVLLRASDLLFIIDAKLQSVEIDHAMLEDLFLDTGLLTREKISSSLGL